MAIIYSAQTNKNTSSWWADNGTEIVNTNYPQGIHAGDGYGNDLQQYVSPNSRISTLITNAPPQTQPSIVKIEMYHDLGLNERAFVVYNADDAGNPVYFTAFTINEQSIAMQANKLSTLNQDAIKVTMDANAPAEFKVQCKLALQTEITELTTGNGTPLKLRYDNNDLFSISNAGQIQTNQFDNGTSPGLPIGQLPIYDMAGVFIGHIRVFA